MRPDVEERAKERARFDLYKFIPPVALLGWCLLDAFFSRLQF